MSLPGAEWAITWYFMFLEGVFNLHHVFSQEEEITGWEILLRTFYIPDGSSGGNLDDGEVLQAKRTHRVRSRHVASEFRIAGGYPSIQRFRRIQHSVRRPPRRGLRNMPSSCPSRTRSAIRSPYVRANCSASFAVTQLEFCRVAAQK